MPTPVDLQTRIFMTSPVVLPVGADNTAVAGPVARGVIPQAPVPPQTPVVYRGQHTHYRVENARIDLREQIDPDDPNVRTLGGALNLISGDTLYLPYINNHITSIRLPVPAPAGVDFFFTHVMTGCKIFVDRIHGSSHIMVYHANALANSTSPAAYADFQNPAALQQLDAYYAAAQQDFVPGTVVRAATSIAMPRYFQNAGHEERRKFNQGRRATAGDSQPKNFQGAQVVRVRPLFVGGCFVCGFPMGAGWDLYFQTWGSVQYARPGYVRMLSRMDWTGVHKRRTQGAEVAYDHHGFRVFEQMRFHQ